MADHLNIPAESWRTPRRSAPMDPQMVRIGVIAAGVAGVLALGMGGYALLGHRSHTIPVVEADSSPVRVRPDNPGGAMVAGAEEQIMGGNGHGQADAMAPAEEAPAPQALRAQIEAEKQPAPAAAPQPPAVQPSAVQPVSLTAPPPSVPAQIAAMPEQRAAAAHPPAKSAGEATQSGTQVQLAALDSEQAAMAEWQRLIHRMPDLLRSRQPAVLRAERGGKTIFRLRTGGFADIASATSFCAQVRSKGAGCSIASF
jgi:SPOR domain